MSWGTNGLLLAAGGIAGLALAAWLESESKNECDYGCDYDDDDGCPRRRTCKADGMELLVEKVRREGEWAMEECITDEEREKVYKEIDASIRKLQAALQERGEEIIAGLKAEALEDGGAGDGEKSEAGADGKFKSTMEELTNSLDEILEELKPESKLSWA